MGMGGMGQMTGMMGMMMGGGGRNRGQKRQKGRH